MFLPLIGCVFCSVLVLWVGLALQFVCFAILFLVVCVSDYCGVVLHVVLAGLLRLVGLVDGFVWYLISGSALVY